jgi:hypothetical protein
MIGISWDWSTSGPPWLRSTSTNSALGTCNISPLSRRNVDKGEILQVPSAELVEVLLSHGGPDVDQSQDPVNLGQSQRHDPRQSASITQTPTSVSSSNAEEGQGTSEPWRAGRRPVPRYPDHTKEGIVQGTVLPRHLSITQTPTSVSSSNAEEGQYPAQFLPSYDRDILGLGFE